jgi:hypothetical protein
MVKKQNGYTLIDELFSQIWSYNEWAVSVSVTEKDSELKAA